MSRGRFPFGTGKARTPGSPHLYSIQPPPSGRSLACAAPWRSVRPGRVSPGAAQPRSLRDYPRPIAQWTGVARSLVKPHPRPGHAGTQARLLPQTSRYANARVVPVRHIPPQRGEAVTDGKRGVTVHGKTVAHQRMDALHRASLGFRFHGLRRKKHLPGLKTGASAKGVL